MAQRRPPEALLHAFSQWLQQWSEYARLQANLFSTSAVSDDPAENRSTAGRSVVSEGQPPAHWLASIPSGAPAHWLALFEEYGLEPPTVDEPPAGSQAGGQTPRPLQEWLGEFQRGLAQFAEQPIAPETPAANPDARGQNQVLVPEHSSSSFVEYGTHARPPKVLLIGQDVQGANPSFATEQLRFPQSDPIQQSEIPVIDSHSPAERASHPDHAAKTQGTEDVAASPAAQVFSPRNDAVPLVPSLVSSHHQPELRTASQTGGELAQDSVEATATPVRLNLHPRPIVAAAVPTPSTTEPAQAALRLLIGVPPSADKSLATRAAPGVDSSYAENRQQKENPVEADFGSDIDPDALSSLIKWRDEMLKSMSSREAQDAPSTLDWSQPAANRWPELPQRPAPIQPASNVLADPVHRMRIAREQKGRSWNG